MTAPANRNPDEIKQNQLIPVLQMVYNPSSGQIEPQAPSSAAAPSAYTHALSITPNDTTDLTITCLAVSVNFDGNVKMRLSGDAGGADVVVYLRAGVLYPLTASRIYTTGTTATGIVLWR